MSDPVFHAFLKEAAEDAAAINRKSAILRLVPDPRSSGAPSSYHGLLWKVEHLEQSPAGTVVVKDEPIPFTFFFPEDYLRGADPRLPLRVVMVHKPIFHPNLTGVHVCLGKNFRPGTRLRGLVHQLYLILSSRTFATEDAFNPSAARYYLDHLAQIEKLRSAPLWRRPVASHASVGPGTASRNHAEGETS
jgi:hypothetical protein